MPSEAAGRADFSQIRYAQVWEDADILLEALDVQPDDECLSIASAGDNALAMLARGPRRVVAIDLNPAQLACLELRVAAFRGLVYHEVLELIGSVASTRRKKLYAQIRDGLSEETREFWDAREGSIANGIGGAGKFENYFRLFRDRMLPLVHTRSTVRALLEPRSAEDRLRFFETRWNTWRWRLMFRLFFSRTAMGALGRDPSFFRYVEGSVADRILDRTRHALTKLDPAANPYLKWILTGQHGDALPFYLREENHAAICRNLDRLQWHLGPLEDFLDQPDGQGFSKFNLSDLFEYLSPENSVSLLERIARTARPGARLAYWNMLAPRRAPEGWRHLEAKTEMAERLFSQDKAFFYSAFVVEEKP